MVTRSNEANGIGLEIQSQVNINNMFTRSAIKKWFHYSKTSWKETSEGE